MRKELTIHTEKRTVTAYIPSMVCEGVIKEKLQRAIIAKRGMYGAISYITLQDAVTKKHISEGDL